MTRWRPLAAAVALAGSSLIAAVGPAAAETLLVVETGQADTQSHNRHELSRADLQALPSVTFQTETIWTDGVQEFSGVQLSDLMQHVGVSTGTMQAYAINAYVVEIPMSDAEEGGPIVAYLRNGEDMSVRDKGPLWVVYPYDNDPRYKSEEVYSRSIWQLERIVVKPDE